MKTTNLRRFRPSSLKYFVCVLLAGFAVFLVVTMPSAQPPGDPDLKVLVTGLGSGTVRFDPSSPLIDCRASCTQGYATGATVTLRRTADTGSTLGDWEGDCQTTPRTDPCTVTMDQVRTVRAKFDMPITTITDFTPDGPTGADGIKRYLDEHLDIDTPAEFVAALPPDFRQNWILMSRSESLQTGIAQSPRILMYSADARQVFTVGMTAHSSYPGSHPNAIEYMQWDGAQKNFRFHEIVLANINQVTVTLPDGSTLVTFPARTRSISIDDAKCPKCHSTRNVPNVIHPVTTPVVRGSTPGTDGLPAGSVGSKNKPNWDTYDSWGGAMPFNRDRIFQGTVEAAAFRKLLNPWTWETNPSVRALIEQLQFQPPGVPDGTTGQDDRIRQTQGGPNDGLIIFPFDSPPVLTEPFPSGTSTTPVTYSFDRTLIPTPPAPGTGSEVKQGGSFVRLHHSGTPTSDEGRAVQLFDLLGGADGNLNQLRIGDELARHRFATGSVPLDARPIALAITKDCLSRDVGANDVTPRLMSGISFFTSRNGMTLNQVFDNTLQRAQTIPRRKADIQKFNLDRRDDVYLDPTAPQVGLIQHYGATTSGISNPPGGMDLSVERIRQEVFRRPTTGFQRDVVIGRTYVDRENYDVGLYNSEKMALYRYFLEPLGVSVDKWSMGVRGRSRTYTFADILTPPYPYMTTFTTELETSLNTAGNRNPNLPGAPPYPCTALLPAVEREFGSLPLPNAVPKYTDVQRIFNKSCIECHGGLGYPPFNRFFDVTYLDLSENEDPALGTRLDRPNRYAMDFTMEAMSEADLMGSPIYRRIIRDNEDCTTTGFAGMMPCGGPKLSQVDIETIKRWLLASPSRPYTNGDPHLKTIDGTNYDFQSAGEFVLLRGENLEIQVRQTPVESEGPLGENEHTNLSTCVSINTAAALRVGPHRITYEPNLSGKPDPSGMQLRVDGNLVDRLSERGVVLNAGGRILPTSAPGGIQIEYPGGTKAIITPNWWDWRQLWYLNVDLRSPRATEGTIGAIAPNNWLPALPDGTLLGPKPGDRGQRYIDLYEKFADAWRVTDATSLFDYAPGTSTSTFTVDSWPLEAPQRCQIPRDPDGGPFLKEPQRQLPIDVAKQQCAPLVEADRRANCEMDVMVTGEVGFAKSYLLTEQVQLNNRPATPVLLSPADSTIDLGTAVSFDWKRTTDAEGDPLRYMHCVWPSGQLHTFKQCVDLPTQMGMFGGLSYCAWLIILLIICLVIVIVLFVKGRRPRILWLVLAIIIVIAIIVVIYFCRTNNLSRTVSALQPGKSYYWKVIVEDGKGGTTESEIRRFAVK